MARHKKNPQNRRLLLLVGATGFVFLNYSSTLIAQSEGFSSHMAQIEEHISNCKTRGFFSDDLGCAKTFPQLYEFFWDKCSSSHCLSCQLLLQSHFLSLNDVFDPFRFDIDELIV